MAQTRIRGIGLRGICAHLRKAERAGLADELIAALPANQRPGSIGFLSASTYDLSVLDALLRGYQRELDGSGRSKDVEARMRAIGESIAEDNLTTVFKMVLSLVKPSTFVEKLPTLWGLYFSNADVSARMTGERSGLCVVRGINVTHLSPIACAWIEYGLKLVGAKPPIRCAEDNWRAGVIAANELRFQVEWG